MPEFQSEGRVPLGQNTPGPYSAHRHFCPCPPRANLVLEEMLQSFMESEISETILII